MSYSTALDGLHVRLALVPGLALLDAGGVPTNILKYEPQSVHADWLLGTTFESYRHEKYGQVSFMVYRVRCRLFIQYQDAEGAEAKLTSFVDGIADTLDADPQLGNVLVRGMAKSPDAQAGWVVVGGGLWRSLDVYVDITEK